MEPENLPRNDRVVFWKGSIADRRILEKITDDFEYVFHPATYHGNQSSIHDPLGDHENNLLPSVRLFIWIKGFRKLNKAVYSGAGCAVAKKTFDQPGPTREDDPISFELDSPYAISKIVGEFYAVHFHKQHRLPAVRARFQNVYGLGEILGAGKWRGSPATVWRNVTPTFIYRALKKDSLPLENRGVASRDFIYVDDVVNGLMLCALRGIPGEVYNLESGKETTIKELAEMRDHLTDNPAPRKYLPKQDWDRSGKRFGSTDKARKEIDFSAQTGLLEGITKTVEWTRQNLDWIDACIAKHKAHMECNRDDSPE